MKRKIICAVLCAVLIFSAFAVFVGCTDGSERLKIVYLGDSIAEAVLGPSPLSERENYGYYALVGKRNGYEYINRSVSGHKTENMLEYISRDDEDAYTVKTHIMTADIIHISILGNDMLQTDVGALIVEMAEQERANESGDYTYYPAVREGILRQSRVNFAAIVAKLRELNPDAVIMFQTVYNPVYPESQLISGSARAKLAELGYTSDDYRRLGGKLISCLNEVIYEYIWENPGAFYIIDAYGAFGEIWAQSEETGKKLVYTDDIHPSNYGHAVMADLIQRKLEELGLADGGALKSYKKLRISQIKELYPDLDYRAIKKTINASSTCEEVTKAYFTATDGIIPSYI